MENVIDVTYYYTWNLLIVILNKFSNITKR